MLSSWKVVIAGGSALAAYVLFSHGAAAGRLAQPLDDPREATTSALAPRPAPAPPTIEADGEGFPSVSPALARRTAHRPRARAIELSDPWSSSEASLAPRSTPTSTWRRRPLDPDNPWTHGPVLPTEPTVRPRPLDEESPWPKATTAAGTPESAAAAADVALREAVKRALDAGELDRAAKLLDILRAPANH